MCRTRAPSFRHQGADPFEQHQARYILVLRVRVGKELADISGRQGTQERVDYGMCQHIRVRVACQSSSKGHDDPTQN